MVKKVSLTVKSMGIPTPIIARGVNPHESIRQSALTLDGPAIDEAIRANDLVMVDAAPNGIPGFTKLPAVAEVVQFAGDRGITITDDANKVKNFIANFSSRFGIVWYGNEQAEMNMLDDSISEAKLSDVIGDEFIECEFNNVVMMRDAYIKHVIVPAVDADKRDELLIGGNLCIVEKGDTLALGAVVDSTRVEAVYGAGASIHPIPGTTVIRVDKYDCDKLGKTFTVVDFVC